MTKKLQNKKWFLQWNVLVITNFLEIMVSQKSFMKLFGKNWNNHLWIPAVYVKEGFPMAQDLSLEISEDFYLCFRLALLHSVCYFFFLYQSPSLLCTVFDPISSNIDEVLSINPSANQWQTIIVSLIR